MPGFTACPIMILSRVGCWQPETDIEEERWTRNAGMYACTVSSSGYQSMQEAWTTRMNASHQRASVDVGQSGPKGACNLFVQSVRCMHMLRLISMLGHVHLS